MCDVPVPITNHQADIMKRLLPVLALFMAIATATWADEDLRFKSIFTGSELSGWKVPPDNIWWKAADGVLQVRSGPQRTGSTLWTAQDYTDFVVQFEFKMGDGTVDSGIFLRHERDQIQIGISGSLKRDMTGSPFIAGKGYPVEAEGVSELLEPQAWNTMKVKADGKHYTVWLNGQQIMAYESETAIVKGPVGIQLHGNRDMAIDYRNIQLGELEQSAM
jgi:hypothetical protein